jgi:hypothetical protein
MAKKDSKGNWIDGRGNSVPPKYISRVDKKREHVIERLIKAAEYEHKRLKELKELVFSRIGEFVRFSEKESGVQMGGLKGNIQLTGFSGDKRVEITVQNRLDFDERLQQAKTLIDELIEEWSEGARSELCLLVNKAFDVDQKGRINVKEILGLRKLKIRNKKWQKAMDLIDDARTVMSNKAYIRFQKRRSDGNWETILIDLAAIDIER